MQIFEHFSIFSRLKPNKSKREIGDTSVLKEVQKTLCGMEWMSRKNITIKILGTHFSGSGRLEDHENYRKYSIKIEMLLKLWIMPQLKIEGKILIFKTSAT